MASCLLLSLFLLFIPCTVFAEQTSPTVALSLTEPADNLTIASGRSFYVFGEMDGSIPKDANLTVTLTNPTGQTFRTVTTNIKNNLNIKTDSTLLSYYDDSDSDLKKLKESGMPDLVWDGIDSNSFTNGSLKVTYSDTDFHALITGGIPTATDDQLNFVDENGNPYTALENGTYTIHVNLYDGPTLLGSSSKVITIGTTSDKILSRFSPNNHFKNLEALAAENHWTLYEDLFPGYWDRQDLNLFAEILPEWRAADAAEYADGLVHCVLYNLKKSSSSYSVELGTLEKQGVIDNPNRMCYYYYDIGEPELRTQTETLEGQIVAMTPGDKLTYTRCDVEGGISNDNEFYQDTPNIISTDTNIKNGVTASVGETLAFYGVAAPLQLADDAIVDNGDNSFTLNNKLSILHYHIKGDGVDKSFDKPIELVRIDANNWTYPSEVEFKHDLTIDKNMAGKTLTVQVMGYDQQGTHIAASDEIFNLAVTADEPTPTPNTPSKTTITDNSLNPATGLNDCSWMIIGILMAVVPIIIFKEKLF